MNDGKPLESLVAFVEKTMLPQGFDVKTNQCIRNDDGVQIAEFDVEIRGRLGTTDIAWLIECRDRPSAGPAPGSWIEQLVGRRTRFGFNKVTAVSTTGFAEGAQDFAKEQGIELRVVEGLTPDSFAWLQSGHMSFFRQIANLEGARVLISEDTAAELRRALHAVVTGANGMTEVLRSSKTGKVSTFAQAFLGAVKHQNLFDGLVPNAPAKKVKLHVQYVGEDDHFVIDTELGGVRAQAIVFCGELSVIESQVPVERTNKYRNLETGETISQVAGFAPQDIHGAQMALEFHRMGEDGETYIILRKANGDA